MAGIFGDAWDWATTPPEFVKKRAKELRDKVEPPSVFDAPYEKYTKPALKAAVSTGEAFATPLDAAGLLVGGAGFAGAEIANRLRRLPKVSNFEHYIDAIRLGKTPAEATKIAASGGRTAADKRRIAENVEAQFRTPRPRPQRAPAFESMPNPRPKPTGGPVRNTASRGKSVIDLAESVRKNARKPYSGRSAPGGDWDEYLRNEWAKYGK